MEQDHQQDEHIQTDDDDQGHTSVTKKWATYSKSQLDFNCAVAYFCGVQNFVYFMGFYFQKFNIYLHAILDYIMTI